MSIKSIQKPALTAITLAVSVAVAYVLYGTIQHFLLSQSGYLVVTEPETITFSAPRDAEFVDVPARLRNISGKRVRIVGASSSCTCLTLDDRLPLALEPFGTCEVHFRIRIVKGQEKAAAISTSTLFVEAGVPVTISFRTQPSDRLADR
jgi:hypothetical protein